MVLLSMSVVEMYDFKYGVVIVYRSFTDLFILFIGAVQYM
jgi:hypothetical protein